MYLNQFQAFKGGDPDAAISLGRLYETGCSKFTPDLQKSAEYFETAVKWGSAEAMVYNSPIVLEFDCFIILV